MTTTSKKCTKCGEVKELGEFAAHCQTKDGKRANCKDCEKRYREQNREKRNQYNRQYYKQNLEKFHEYREENREKHNEYKRQYREENRKKIIEYQRQYRARQKAMREFFKMHKALAQITEALQRYTQP